jgi:hypothetical protein
LDFLINNVARVVMRLPALVLRDLLIPAAERAHSVGNYDDGMFKFRVYQEGEELYVDVPPSVRRQHRRRVSPDWRTTNGTPPYAPNARSTLR